VAIEIRLLRETDDRTIFRSGDPDLDRFFARYAGQNQFRHHTGTTYVAAEADGILGYATIAAGNVEVDALPAPARRKLPRYPLPVLRLARLAVDAAAQSRGVGSALLRHVFLLALRMSEGYGCVGIVVDAKADAAQFYARVGFSPLEVSEGELESRPKPTPMFLPLELIAAALAPSGT
jgi:GNAT superfamily N-acetyltransferase